MEGLSLPRPLPRLQICILISFALSLSILLVGVAARPSHHCRMVLHSALNSILSVLLAFPARSHPTVYQVRSPYPVSEHCYPQPECDRRCAIVEEEVLCYYY